MPFTEEERQRWHDEKRRRETPPPRPRSEPVTECMICMQPFGFGEGNVASDFPICNRCDD